LRLPVIFDRTRSGREEDQGMANKLAAAGPNSVYKLPDAQPAGFWAGFWHGAIAPIAFFVGLFNPGVRMYETNNSGGWYDLGFLLGASMSLGGSTFRGGSGEEEEEIASNG
jgi:hypothetical protein